MIKNVYALGEEEFYEEKVSFYAEETPTKIIYKAIMENNEEYSCEYIKNTGKVYMNNHEIEYSFGEGTPVSNLDKSNDNRTIDLYATTDPWTPITIIEDYYIDFAPFIDAVANAAGLAAQFHLGMKAVTTAALLAKLQETSVKKVWSVIGDMFLSDVIGYIRENGSSIINATFYYDMQKTSGLVDLMGSGVKVTAYRYANYEGKIYLGGVEKYSGGTDGYGGWWSASKPYSLGND